MIYSPVLTFSLSALFARTQNLQGAPPAWDVNVLNGVVKQLGKSHFSLVIADPAALGDFENNTLVLYARTEDECKAWVASLHHASTRTLEGYYIVGNVIGEGGFAEVRIGKSKVTGRKVAIKTMKKHEAHMKLYGREIAILKRVDHPNIVKTYDLFETATKIHIVMEHMQGGMLYDAIEDGVKFEEQDTAQFMREIIDGILYLHENGIVHRDLKPENVLCTSTKIPLHVKIADFGLSSIMNDHRRSDMLMSTMIGTPEFVAPEIANRQEYTEKVDMWALGMLCYNVVAGNLPIDESKDCIPQLMHGVELNFPEREWESYSPEAKSFIRALLCTRPEKRLTPLACLVHPWLVTLQRSQSSKFESHGRVSGFLHKQLTETGYGHTTGGTHVLGSASERPHSSENSIALSSTEQPTRRVAGRLRSGQEWWVIAFIAVKASNRLIRLVSPHKVNVKETDETHVSTSAGSNSSRTASFVLPDTDPVPFISEDANERIRVTQSFPTPIHNRKSSNATREPTSLRSLGGLMRSLQDARAAEKQQGGMHVPLSPASGGLLGITKTRNFSAHGTYAGVEDIQTNVKSKVGTISRSPSRPGLPSRKGSILDKEAFRKKIIGGLEGPARKLSRRLLTKRGEEELLSPVTPKEAESGLDDLGFEVIDESDFSELLQTEQESQGGRAICPGSVGSEGPMHMPSAQNSNLSSRQPSLYSKAHRVLLRK